MTGSIIHGDCIDVMAGMPDGSVHLTCTSPPYYNARDYASYGSYVEYLDVIERTVAEIHRVTAEGRFLAINTSPVLTPRRRRGDMSTRHPIPFDLHARIASVGFDFVDDIIWAKPEGGGWNAGRGRRFSADRQPLQYKPVPVTEYIMVYRKKTDKLIDWNIRQYDDDTVRQSLILGSYDVTNIWNISPANDDWHPAVFPIDLPKKIIRYYSFVGDVVLDPFCGSGTTCAAAASLGRKYIGIDISKEYCNVADGRVDTLQTMLEPTA